MYHEANVKDFLCPVWVLGQMYVHIQQHDGTNTTMLSSYWAKGTRVDMTAEHVSKALKSAATELQYPTNKGIPVSRINTHTPCKVVVPAHCPSADILTSRFRKWADGARQCSKSILGRNLHDMHATCHGI